MSDRDLAAGVALSDLADGVALSGSFDGENVVLVRRGDRVCALSGKCTHLQAPLADGVVVDGELRCPWHHARFDLATGEAVSAPALKPLDRFTVIERDGRAIVTGKVAADTAIVPLPEVGRVVIVGGGAAGHACADMLARHGAGAAVTMLSDDRDAPYDRTFCSKQYLAGKATRSDTTLPSPGMGRGAAATICTGVSVTELNLADRTVVSAKGKRFAYDTLILATGASAVLPGFDGADRDDVFVLRTLVDADAIVAAAANASAAVVIGASYIGLEVAASLTQRGLKVTVVAEGEVPLEKTAGPEVGAMVRSVHEEKGVVFRMGQRVVSWDGAAATLNDGTRVEATLLVAGTGVTPRLDLAQDAGLRIADQEAGGGVLVDGTLQTSARSVYAIGDIASVPDPRLGHPIRVEHWVVAQRMGQWLGRHLLGLEVGSYTDVPFFWSGHYDTNLRYVGHVASPDDRAVDGDPEEKDLAVTFREVGADRALLTCGRDRLSLETEAGWER